MIPDTHKYYNDSRCGMLQYEKNTRYGDSGYKDITVVMPSCHYNGISSHFKVENANLQQIWLARHV